MGPTWSPVGPRWAPCWPHKPCSPGSPGYPCYSSDCSPALLFLPLTHGSIPNWQEWRPRIMHLVILHNVTENWSGHIGWQLIRSRIWYIRYKMFCTCLEIYPRWKVTTLKAKYRSFHARNVHITCKEWFGALVAKLLGLIPFTLAAYCMIILYYHCDVMKSLFTWHVCFCRSCLYTGWKYVSLDYIYKYVCIFISWVSTSHLSPRIYLFGPLTRSVKWNR